MVYTISIEKWPKSEYGIKAEFHQHLAHKRAVPLCRCSEVDTNHVSEECFVNTIMYVRSEVQ